MKTRTAVFAIYWALVVIAVISPGTLTAQQEDSEQRFLSENRRVMDKMMQGMAPTPTGNVDRDFASMMMPHHQGAIEMAVLELQFGRNEQLRRIAQEIIIEQQQEIGAMRLALGQPPTPSAAAPTEDQTTDRSVVAPIGSLSMGPISGVFR